MVVESAPMKVNYTESEKQHVHILPHPKHQDDIDDEDENVKQLGDCSAVYLALQVPVLVLIAIRHQDCLVATNRNWKACQSKVQALKRCSERRMNSVEK